MIKYKFLNLEFKIWHQSIKPVFQKESPLLINCSPGWSFSNPVYTENDLLQAIPQSCFLWPLLLLSLALVFVPASPSPHSQLGCEPLLSRGKDPRPCSWHSSLTPQPSSAGLWLMWAIPQSSSLFFVIGSALGRSPLWKKKSNPTKNLNLVCRCHEKLSKPLI